MSDDLVNQAIAELQGLVQCRCHPAYKDRKLRDPDCHCDNAENVKIVADRIEALVIERDWYRERVVWGFYEDYEPKYYQGKEGEHEICDPVTAEGVTRLLRSLNDMESQLANVIAAFRANMIVTSDRYTHEAFDALIAEIVRTDGDKNV